MQVRSAKLAAGLKDRLPSPPALSELFAAYDQVDDETLASLAATGPWETVGSGGAVVDVDAILRVEKGSGSRRCSSGGTAVSGILAHLIVRRPCRAEQRLTREITC